MPSAELHQQRKVEKREQLGGEVALIAVAFTESGTQFRFYRVGTDNPLISLRRYVC